MTPSQPRFAAARPINQFLRCGVGKQVWFCQPIFQASPTLWITAEKRITFRDLIPDLAVTCRRNRLERLWGGCPRVGSFSAQRTPDCAAGGSCRGSQAGAARFPGVLLSRGAAAGRCYRRGSAAAARSRAADPAATGLPGGDPGPAPLHGPGHPGDIEHGVLGFAGDREHRQPPVVCKFVLGGARGLEQGGGPR